MRSHTQFHAVEQGIFRTFAIRYLVYVTITIFLFLIFLRLYNMCAILVKMGPGLHSTLQSLTILEHTCYETGAEVKIFTF